MQTISLNGIWAVAPTSLAGTVAEATEWLEAAVPGEVHLDLVRAGRMDDPAVSDHARSSGRWPEEHAWWYRTTITVDDAFLAHERQELVFDGLDCFAQVYLNETLVGTACNAFVGHRFGVRNVLRAGENTLVVRLTAGTELVQDKPHLGNWFSDIYTVRNFTMQRFLRKPQYQYGWDWNDPLPTIGIWREARLEGRSGADFAELRLDTVIEDEAVALVGQAVLENLHPWEERRCVLALTLEPPEGAPITQETALLLPMGKSAAPLRLEVPDPRLWWPNGMGEQPLYRLTGRLLIDGETCDVAAQTIGLRTVAIDRAPLADGTRFCICVNGVETFCRGGNLAPPDMIPARVTPERWERLVAEAREAHFTMFRVNGVGYYPDDAFFEACDRAGILLWQDFTFACMTYPDDAEFRTVVDAETRKVVSRLRHHPSLAVWCGCNESIWLNSGGKDPYTLGGITLFGQVLPDVCRQLDPVRPYWPCSPFGGAEPNSENAGNCHWWFPFFMNPEVDRCIRHETVDECRARFVSEYGIIGPPHLDSVHDYLHPEEMHRESLAFRIHTNTFERGIVAAGIRHHYGDPDGLALPEYLLYGQMFQALLQGGAMEALRFRKGDLDAECWGALIWSYNDCWGEMGWSVIDHYLRRKASYYWLRRACAPVKVIVRPRGEALVTRIVNDTRQAYDAEVRHGWFRVDGRDQRLEITGLRIPANGMVEVARAPLPADLAPEAWIYGAVLAGDGFAGDQATWLRAPVRELALADPALTVTPVDGGVEVSSPVFCHAVHGEDGGHGVFSDNWFDLLPGVPRRILGAVPELTAVVPVGNPEDLTRKVLP
jgi:beta-mannosidase